MRYSDRLQIHRHELACVVFSCCRSTAVEITAPLQCSHVSHLQKLHISYQGTCLSAALNATLHRLFTCSLFFLLVTSNHSLIHLLFSSPTLGSDLLHVHKWVRPTLYYKISINEILKQNIWVGICNMSWGYTLLLFFPSFNISYILQSFQSVTYSSFENCAKCPSVIQNPIWHCHLSCSVQLISKNPKITIFNN